MSAGESRKNGKEPTVNLSPKVADEIKTTTCYMCACRCGIKVHLQDGQVRYIEGNRDHPVNKGVLCGKGAAGIMQHLFAGAPARADEAGRPARLRRVPGNFAGTRRWRPPPDGCGEIRKKDPRKLAFFTGRDQSQALTGWWASQFGTPNFAAHGGFCSVNMAAGGLYTFGGSFWEFGEPDWERTKYFMLFGVAEDHASNPIKIGTRQAEGTRRQGGRRSTRCAPATVRSPTSGSASSRARTACSSAR